MRRCWRLWVYSTLGNSQQLLTSQTEAFGPNQVVQTDHCALAITLSYIVNVQQDLQRSCC
jgi:hypothetical protein